MAAQLDERILAAAHPHHLVALAAQIGAQQLADVRLVLNDQDSRCHAGIVGVASARPSHTLYTQLTFT